MTRHRSFDRTAEHRYAIYARMSTDQQNPQSPEQQIDTIRQTIARQRLPWTEVKTYTDRGRSGRTVRHRQGLMALLADLQNNTIHYTVLVVDTRDRLSRSKAGAQLVELLHKHGIVLLTANTDLNDPTTPDGELMSMLDGWRSEQENLIKGHMVLRGKRHTVQAGHWPGGPVPIGYRLEYEKGESRGCRRSQHSRLVPDERTRCLPEMCWRLAAERGWGGVRISEFLNNDPEFPQHLKPVDPSRVTYILNNDIYLGRFSFGKKSVDYEEDIRFLEPNDREEWTVNNQFCEPLARPEWEEIIRQQQQARSAHRNGNHDSSPVPRRRGRGVALMYPLSGLLICEHCQHSMVAYTRGDHPAERQRLAAYRCPKQQRKLCSNRTQVPQVWLWQQVMNLILEQLLPGFDLQTMDQEQIAGHSAFLALQHLVSAEVSRLEAALPDTERQLETERQQLQDKKRGWLLSLADASLSPVLRRQLQDFFDEADNRLRLIDQLLQQHRQKVTSLTDLCTPQRVVEELRQFQQFVRCENASQINLQLSRLIDTITVTTNGTVRVRFSLLACLADPSVTSQYAQTVAEPADRATEVPRMRARRPSRNVPATCPADPLAISFPQDNGINIDRFDGWPDDWFQVVEWTIPIRRSWSEEHALEVAESRLASPCNLDTLAERFGKSRPTIQAAIKHAKLMGVDATRVDGRHLQPNWAKDHADEVAGYYRQHGENISQAARHFGKSTTWVREALRNAGIVNGRNESDLPERIAG